jgi:hypothetical protein
MVVFDGSRSSDEALEVAGDLVQQGEGRLIVLIIAEDTGQAHQFMDFISNWADASGVTVFFHWLKDADPFMLCSIAQTETSGMLVLPKDSPALSDELVLTILSDINCPVIFVRQTD